MCDVVHTWKKVHPRAGYKRFKPMSRMPGSISVQFWIECDGSREQPKSRVAHLAVRRIRAMAIHAGGGGSRSRVMSDRMSWNVFQHRAVKLLPLDCASAVGGALARRIGPFLGVSSMLGATSAAPFPSFSEIGIAPRMRQPDFTSESRAQSGECRI
jgi:hypothetical protein